jgi:predicted metal-binding membrane protein
MPTPAWSLANWAAVFTMSTVMMVAVMLPPAAPMILYFAALDRKRGAGGRTLVFVAAYLALWAALSAAAAAAQWQLQRLGWVSPVLVSLSSGLNAALLLTAGAYQFSPPKRLPWTSAARRPAF